MDKHRFIAYDRDADALSIRLSDRKSVDSEEVSEGIVLDYDDEDRVVGIEVLNVLQWLLG